jgi:hypothetical protein
MDGLGPRHPDPTGSARLAPRVPLPPYRYLPGRTPHPSRAASGHLRLRRPEDAPRDDDETIRYGFDLFAAGYFWEAHEAWESAWHRAGGAERTVLQSLIQLAAGHLKRELRAPRAAGQLYRAALHRLDSLAAPAVLGVSIARLRRALERGLTNLDSPPAASDSLLDAVEPG